MNIIEHINSFFDNKNVIKLSFSKTNRSDNIYETIDIFTDNIIKKLINLIDNKCKNITKKFIRQHYYSQIRENNIIYTDESQLLDIMSNNKYNLYILQDEKIIQDKLSFPNLNEYHFTQNLIQNIYSIKNMEIIIENDKIIFIKLQKNYDEKLLKDILELLDI